MKKTNLIKTIGFTSGLGIVAVTLPTILTSCSDKPNLVVNNINDWNKWVADHHNEFKNPSDLINYSDLLNNSDKLIEYFVTQGRLSGNNILYSSLNSLVSMFTDSSTEHTALKLKITTNENGGTYKFTDDFKATNAGTTIECKKGLIAEIKISQQDGFYSHAKGTTIFNGEDKQDDQTVTAPFDDLLFQISYYESADTFSLIVSNKQGQEGESTLTYITLPKDWYNIDWNN